MSLTDPTTDPTTARLAALEQEVARLRHDLQMLATLDRHREAVLQRHPASPLLPAVAAVDACAFTAAGEGFHAPELSPDGTTRRWTGPEPEARLVFWVDRTLPCRLLLRLGHFGRSQTVTVAVDGIRFQVQKQDVATPITIGPLPPRPAPGPTLVVLVPETMFVPAQDGGVDTRRLGISLVSAVIEPMPPP